jgi:hypothetical protein
MPAVGDRKSTTLGTSQKNTKYDALSESFINTVNSIRKEHQINMFANPDLAIATKATKEALRQFYINESFDVNDPTMSVSDKSDKLKDLNEMFENTCEAIAENAYIGEYNPVIGMSLPMHKFIMLNNIFDNSGIPTVVARAPKWTETIEYPYMIGPNGEKINLFFQQNQIRNIMNSAAPFVEYEVTVPHNAETDFLDAAHLGHPTGNISIASYISAVKISVYVVKGDILPDGTVVGDAAGADVNAPQAMDVWYNAKYEFKPTYGTNARVLQVTVEAPARDASGVAKVYKDVLSANFEDNRFKIMSLQQGVVIKAVKLKLKIDTSDAMVKTASVAWNATSDLFEIPEATPINVPIRPEEVRDISALYNVNQVSKIMSLIQLVMGTYKDDTIKAELDNSFETIADWQKTFHKIDFAPRNGYALSHVDWRYKTVMDAIDTYTTELVSIWRDPNITITIFGRPDIIRKITPTEYTYQTPSNIGPVALDFTKTVVTSDNRVYNFVSSMKLNGTNELIIVINPRNTDRFIYRIYNYQLYVSNEIRNSANPALPAIHAFERFKFCQYQPVQGRIEILNPSGLKDEDTDAVGYYKEVNNGGNANNGYSL